MGSRNNSSFFYRLLFAFARFNFRLFYRTIRVEGINNIPVNRPVIFAANHQNALMDALAMLFSTNKEIFFLSRADIFKKRLVAKLLTFLRIMPVYRPRDGVETMHMNVKVFEKAAQFLQSGIPLGIFPEGSHQEKKRLFPLKKGICRIAFEAAEMTNYNLDLTIVPIGIDYSNFQDRGADLVVIIGEPIAVSEYYNMYRENPNKAITKLSDTISRALKPLMIHVQNLHEYTSIINISDRILLAKKEVVSRNQPFKIFLEKQKLINYLDNLSIQDPEAFDKLRNSTYPVNNYSVTSESMLSNHLILKVKLVVLVLITSVITLPGIFFNLLPYLVISYKVKKVKDSQFKSSYDFVLSMLAYPLWHLILFSIALVFFNLLTAVLILALGLLTGLFTLRITYYIKHMVRIN